VARRIAELEADLGRPLVHRTTQGASLEPEALPYVALAEQLERGLSATRRDAPEAGVVRVSVGEGFARSAARVLADFQRANPLIHIELSADSRLADLTRREADLGVRTIRSGSKALIEKRIGVLRLGLFASRAYVERRLGSPTLARADFERHDFIGHEGALKRLPHEQWLQAHGAHRFPFRSSSDEALLEVACRGQGLALLARAQAGALSELVELKLEGCEPPPAFDIYLALHREVRKVPRVRAVAHALELGVRAGLESA
jgi:DNA-binding transcriptional LysR family regulator